MRHDRTDRGLAGRRQLGDVPFQALQGIAPAGGHASTVRHEIGPARRADGAELRLGRLLRLQWSAFQRQQQATRGKNKHSSCSAHVAPARYLHDFARIQ
jgi:hypothetical protein